ncbi:MAG: glycosyltransferase [Candidatus Diapherotrites archaeon]|nr:glycosyltransferase [Candidatus Diapherotrites archaeon]
MEKKSTQGAHTNDLQGLENKPFVSVIVPCYNCAKTVPWTLDALKNQAYKAFEVILVDDCSTDKTLGLLEKSRFKVVRHEKNKGSGAARNTGIRNSKGSILLFLDSDARADSTWIQGHVNGHLNGCTVVGGSTRPLHNNFIGMADHYSTWYDFSPNAKRDEKRLQLASANLSVDRKAMQRVGGFREDLRNNEDADICARMKKNGCELVFEPGLVIYHHDRETFRSFLRHHYNYGKATPRMRTKGSGTRYEWIIPKNRFTAFLGIAPLAVLFTGYVLFYWLRHEPKALIYAPLIFLSKLAHTYGVYKGFE